MNSQNAYDLTYRTGVSNLELEGAISKDVYSYSYAKNVIKCRFELGEKAISENCICAYGYAKNVIKCRFELGEKAISESGYHSWAYARDILKSRFRLGEKSIDESINLKVYCYEVLGYNHE